MGALAVPSIQRRACGPRRFRPARDRFTRCLARDDRGRCGPRSACLAQRACLDPATAALPARVGPRDRRWDCWACCSCRLWSGGCSVATPGGSSCGRRRGRCSPARRSPASAQARGRACGRRRRSRTTTSPSSRPVTTASCRSSPTRVLIGALAAVWLVVAIASPGVACGRADRGRGCATDCHSSLRRAWRRRAPLRGRHAVPPSGGRAPRPAPRGPTRAGCRRRPLPPRSCATDPSRARRRWGGRRSRRPPARPDRPRDGPRSARKQRTRPGRCPRPRWPSSRRPSGSTTCLHTVSARPSRGARPATCLELPTPWRPSIEPSHSRSCSLRRHRSPPIPALLGARRRSRTVRPDGDGEPRRRTVLDGPCRGDPRPGRGHGPGAAARVFGTTGEPVRRRRLGGRSRGGHRPHRRHGPGDCGRGRAARRSSRRRRRPAVGGPRGPGAPCLGSPRRRDRRWHSRPRDRSWIAQRGAGFGRRPHRALDARRSGWNPSR